MKTHRIRVQVQQGRYETIASTTYEENYPCSKRDALRLLDRLEQQSLNYSPKKQWGTTMSYAIGQARNWVERARRMDAQGSIWTAYSKDFTYDSYTYRIDVEIIAGTGHFS